MGLDQYAYVKNDETDEQEAQFIWRKHAKLHDWMESLFELRTGKPAGDLNYGGLVLCPEDIVALRAAIEGNTLPTCAGGFFFGHEIQDEQAEHYRSYDLKFCDWAEEQFHVNPGAKLVQSPE